MRWIWSENLKVNGLKGQKQGNCVALQYVVKIYHGFANVTIAVKQHSK